MHSSADAYSKRRAKAKWLFLLEIAIQPHEILTKRREPGLPFVAWCGVPFVTSARCR